jgi:hypothetical protein
MKRRGRFAVDLDGQRFGRLVVIERIPGFNKSGHAKYLCQCDCGETSSVAGMRLRRGDTVSCGCYARERSRAATTHGMTKHRLFPTWQSMMARCYKAHCPAFPDYGGRGIVVCDRWKDVRHFIADNEHLALPGLSIDRRDNDGPYAPENARWITRAEQSLNRRSNVHLTYQGRTQTIFEWAREIGIAPRTLWHRIRTLRWPTDKAIQTPVKQHTSYLSTAMKR